MTPTEIRVRSSFPSEARIQNGIWDLGSGKWGVRSTKWGRRSNGSRCALADEMWILDGYDLAEVVAWHAALSIRVKTPFEPVEVLDLGGSVIAVVSHNQIEKVSTMGHEKDIRRMEEAADREAGIVVFDDLTLGIPPGLDALACLCGAPRGAPHQKVRDISTGKGWCPNDLPNALRALADSLEATGTLALLGGVIGEQFTVKIEPV